MNRIINYFKRLIFFIKTYYKDRVDAQQINTKRPLLDKGPYIENPSFEIICRSVLDGFIDIYTRTARRLIDLGKEQELERLLKIMHGNLKHAGIKIQSSSSGAEFDHETMVISYKESFLTNKKELANKVSVSVVPLFIWDLPIEGRSDSHLILKKEEVILWEYTDKPIIQETLPMPPQKDNVATISLNTKIPTTVSSLVGSSEERLKISSPIGYLVVIENNEILCILTVDPDVKNVYGSHPVEKEGISCHPISLLNEHLTSEHFYLQQDNNSNQIEAVLLDGIWSINSKNKNVQQTTISDGDTIYIGDISFKYIENVGY